MTPAAGGGRAILAIVLVTAILAAATPVDETLHDLIFRHFVSHELRLLANGVTLLGTVEVAAGGAIGLAVVAARAADLAMWQGALGALAGIAIGGLATQVVKHVACRARPRLVDGWGVGPRGAVEIGEHRGFFHWPCLTQEHYQGFPSGHAATAFAVMAALLTWAPAWRRPLWLAAAAVALSRVVLNAHYLSDVLAGGVLGWWAGRLGVGFVRRHAVVPWRRAWGPARTRAAPGA